MTPPDQPDPEPVVCPFCGSRDTEELLPFGSALLTSQYGCRACRTYFERVRWQRRRGDEDERESGRPAH